jgi:transcriptional regulator with XRE-family HTH domain
MGAMPPSVKKNVPLRISPRRNLVGMAIKNLRKEQKLTCEELAAKVHLRGWDAAAKVIVRIENGRREVNDIEIRVLAKALRVPVAALFEGS